MCAINKKTTKYISLSKEKDKKSWIKWTLENVIDIIWV